MEQANDAYVRALPGIRREPAGRRPLWPVLLVVALLYTPMLVQRTTAFGMLGFVHIGRQMLEAGHSSTVIVPSLGWHQEVGYDGQYYFALAVDPPHAKDYMPAGIAGIVYSRPVYPALARVVGVGSTEAVPYAMLILNLFAVGVGTLAVAAWLRRRGLTPWLALLYGLFPGLVFSVFRDLTEPLAFGLVALAGLVLDGRSRRSFVGSALLFALAALTRETTLVFAVVVAVSLLSGGWDREPTTVGARWRRATTFLLASVGPLLMWRLVVAHLVSGPTQERGDGLRSLVPFHGIADYWPWDRAHVVIVATVVLPTIVALLAAATLLRRSATRLSAFLLVLNAAAFVLFLPTGVDVDYGAAGRAAVGVVLATIVCLPAWSSDGRISRRSAAVTLAWSLPWYLFMSALVGFPGVSAITL